MLPNHPVPTRSRGLAQLLCVLTMVLISGAPRAALEEGKNFMVLAPPQPTSERNKIEVVEFFSYACPHCARFYPLLSAWVAKLPPDVLFRRVPVGFNRDLWINLQRAYYALDATGDLARLDGPLFHALHEERRPLVDAASLAQWVGENGGNADKFTAAYVSLAVNKESFQADQMAEEFRIEGIPSLAVDGRYVTHGEATSDEEQGLKALLANVDELIERVRNERAAKPAASLPKAPK
jgi:thiol:disulfide interchange protein DsbA